MDPQQLVRDELLRACSGGIFSGAQVCVSGSHPDAFWESSIGSTHQDDGADVTSETFFDLASLTKALCTSLLAMIAVGEGRLNLDERAKAYGLGDAPIGDVPVWALLNHTSSLVAWRPYFEWVDIKDRLVGRGEDTILTRILGERTRWYYIDPADPGSAVWRSKRDVAADEDLGAAVYSDLGYIVLGRILEEVFGAPLDQIFHEHIALPLGLDLRFLSTGVEPLVGGEPPSKPRIAATEICAYRGLVHGQVHDDNAFAMGGVAGHAGLFGSARSVARLGSELLRIWRGEKSDVNIQTDVLRHFWSAQWCTKGSYVLGWDTPSGPNSTAGYGATRGATYGHLGFTGTSVWIDTSKDRCAVFLSNRVHPSREEPRMRSLRPQIHDLLWTVSLGEHP